MGASPYFNITYENVTLEPKTALVSVGATGDQGNVWSYRASLSANARYIAFDSYSTNLVPDDTNGVWGMDVFVHDRQTGATKRVSIDSAGMQANETSCHGCISADGRYVAFASTATNLVPSDTNGLYSDIFIHDCQTGTTEMVSVSSSGVQSNYTSNHPALSADSRFVAFQSGASNLVPGDTNGFADIFVRDRQTGTTERVSVDSSGNQSDSYSGYHSSISADGRYVAFDSDATNLVPGDTNGATDVFVRDRQTGTTVRLSVDSSGLQVSGHCYHASISNDGRYVAFMSRATDLVPSDTNQRTDVFVRDRQANTTERVSVDSSGTEGNDGSNAPSISADGRYVAFSSDASNLVPDDNNRGSFLGTDIFVHDRQTGITERVSVNSSGGEAMYGRSQEASISADGRYVAFSSADADLVPVDTNGAMDDIFLRGRGHIWSGGSVMYVNASAPGGGNGVSWGGSLNDLQQALEIAASHCGPAITEIWVAAGTYAPAMPGAPPTGGSRCATFKLVNGVNVYGGFVGTESSLGERDPAANETILTNAPGNCRNVVTGPPPTGTTDPPILDGFTITTGEAPIDSVGEFFLDGKVIISNCTIWTQGNRYLDLSPFPPVTNPPPGSFEPPELSNNVINVTIPSDPRYGLQGALLELRAHDADCGGTANPDCLSGAYDASTSDVFTAEPSLHWVLESLEIENGAQVNLTNRPGFQFLPGETEAVYVRNLVLGPNATLNTALQTLYYQNLTEGEGARIVDVPLLGFSLGVIEMNDQTEFNVRVRSRTREPADASPGSVIFVADGRGANDGVMEMRAQNATSVAAKGSFARAGEENIVVAFEYQFLSDGDAHDAELVVSLSSISEVGDTPCGPTNCCDADRCEVARVRLPAAGVAGRLDTGYATFYQVVPYEDWSTHLSKFNRGTYVETELRGKGAIVRIDNFDPQVICSSTCADYTKNGVSEDDFLILLAESGRAMSADDPKACLDGKLSRDGYIGLSDLLSWDTYVAGGFDSCGSGGASAMVSPPRPEDSIKAGAATKGSDPQMAEMLPGIPTGALVVSGKSDSPGDQSDALYSITGDGTCTASSTPPAGGADSRANGRLVRDSQGKIYQLRGSGDMFQPNSGLVRLADGVVVVGPNNNLSSGNDTVKVGVTPLGGDAFDGVPVSDAVFDPNDPTIVYLVPVLVSVPEGTNPAHTYRAIAKLVLDPANPGEYSLGQLYDTDLDPYTDPLANTTTPPEASPYNVQKLREVEIDATGQWLYVTSSQGQNGNEWLLIYSTAGGPSTRVRLTDLCPTLKSPDAMLVSSRENKLYLTSSIASSGSSPVFRLAISGNSIPTCEGSIAISDAKQILSISEDPANGKLYVLGFQMPDIPEDLSRTDPLYQQYFSNDSPLFTTPRLSTIQPATTWTSSTAQAVALSTTDLALPISGVLATGRTGDFDGDGDVDTTDLDLFHGCALGPAVPRSEACAPKDLDTDGDVDQDDFGILQRAYTGIQLPD